MRHVRQELVLQPVGLLSLPTEDLGFCVCAGQLLRALEHTIFKLPVRAPQFGFRLTSHLDFAREAFVCQLQLARRWQRKGSGDERNQGDCRQ